MSEFGLDDHALRLIREVFARHPTIREARIFGSRAKGNYRPESDVDIAIFGDVDGALVSVVAGELDDLPLPYGFDVQAYNSIKHAALREHIDRVGLQMFVRS